MLVEHRIDDMNESLVAVEQPMPAGQQVALQPTLTLVLAQHLHHTSAAGKELVTRHGRGVPLPLGHLEYRLQAI